jgi:dihydroorotase
MTHGLYAGITADPEQIRGVAGAHARLYPRVVGLKLYAGHSTGRMGVVSVREQELVWRTLAEVGYRGVVAVHAEKEDLLGTWDPGRPSSHATARPPEAEMESARDQIRLAAEAGFRGVLHLAHVSVPGTLGIVREARARSPGYTITTGVTPHHVLLCAEDMDRPGGHLLKVNPPLRPRAMAGELLAELLAGAIDWIETDHAPHTLRDKTEAHASGIPVFPFYRAFLPEILFPYPLAAFEEWRRGLEWLAVVELSYRGQLRRFLSGLTDMDDTIGLTRSGGVPLSGPELDQLVEGARR